MTDSAQITPFGGLHGSGNDKTQFERIAELERDLSAAREWREAVLNELIVAHIYTKEHDTNPRKAIQDAITWNCQVALDPAVSSDAQKLIAAAQEDLQFVERWANHHGVKPTCTAEAALSIIQHYPPILAITRSYADGKVPETRNPWAELQEAQEARKRAEERAAACKKDAERWKKYLEIYDSEELAEAAWGGAGEITKTVDAAIAARTK